MMCVLFLGCFHVLWVIFLGKLFLLIVRKRAFQKKLIIKHSFAIFSRTELFNCCVSLGPRFIYERLHPKNIPPTNPQVNSQMLLDKILTEAALDRSCT